MSCVAESSKTSLPSSNGRNVGSLLSFETSCSPASSCDESKSSDIDLWKQIKIVYPSSINRTSAVCERLRHLYAVSMRKSSKLAKFFGLAWFLSLNRDSSQSHNIAVISASLLENSISSLALNFLQLLNVPKESLLGGEFVTIDDHLLVTKGTQFYYFNSLLQYQATFTCHDLPVQSEFSCITHVPKYGLILCLLTSVTVTNSIKRCICAFRCSDLSVPASEYSIVPLPMVSKLPISKVLLSNAATDTGDAPGQYIDLSDRCIAALRVDTATSSIQLICQWPACTSLSSVSQTDPLTRWLSVRPLSSPEIYRLVQRDDMLATKPPCGEDRRDCWSLVCLGLPSQADGVMEELSVKWALPLPLDATSTADHLSFIAPLDVTDILVCDLEQASILSLQQGEIVLRCRIPTVNALNLAVYTKHWFSVLSLLGTQFLCSVFQTSDSCSPCLSLQLIEAATAKSLIGVPLVLSTCHYSHAPLHNALIEQDALTLIFENGLVQKYAWQIDELRSLMRLFVNESEETDPISTTNSELMLNLFAKCLQPAPIYLNEALNSELASSLDLTTEKENDARSRISLPIQRTRQHGHSKPGFLSTLDLLNQQQTMQNSFSETDLYCLSTADDYGTNHHRQCSLPMLDYGLGSRKAISMRSVGGTCSPDATGLSQRFAKARLSGETKVDRAVAMHSMKFGAFGSHPFEFREPNGIAVLPDGTLVISDGNAQAIKFFNHSGRYLTSWSVMTVHGTKGFPTCLALRLPPSCESGGIQTDFASMCLPGARQAHDPEWGLVVVLRRPTPAIYLYTLRGQLIRAFATELQSPKAVAVNGTGHIVVVESQIMRISTYTWQGASLSQFTASELSFPISVAFDSANSIYVADNQLHCVVIYNCYGDFIGSIGGRGMTDFPVGVCLTRILRPNHPSAAPGQLPASSHAWNNSLGSSAYDEAILIVDNHNHLNVTTFRKTGEVIHAMRSNMKHAQVCAVAIDTHSHFQCGYLSNSIFPMDTMTRFSLVFSSKDCRVYRYSLPPKFL